METSRNLPSICSVVSSQKDIMRYFSGNFLITFNCITMHMIGLKRDYVAFVFLDNDS